MLRLIIVDDERIIRETIYHLIDWNTLGVEVVGVCKNGLEAYDAILDEYPDLVLTDIKMPGLSGLELIEKLRHTHEQVHFIILSGYEEFEYAKQAMRYGIKHYLLKPCNEQQIISAVLEIKKEILSSKKTLLPDRISADFEKNMFRNLFIEGISTEAEVSSLYASYEGCLDFYTSSYTLYCLYFLEAHNLEACKENIYTYMEAQYPLTFFAMLYVKNSFLLCIKGSSCEVPKLEAYLSSLSFPIQTVSLVLEQKPYTCLEEFFTYIRPKLQRYDKLYYLEKERTIPFYNYSCCISKAQKICEKYSLEKEQETLKQEFLELFSSIQEKDFLITLMVNIILKQTQTGSPAAVSSAADFFQVLNCAENTTHAIELFMQQFDSFFPTSTGNYKPFIEKLLAYMEAHLSDPDLSLKWIANNHLYMNVDYISKQFYKQTGEKFSGYLNKLRIQRAKSLLAGCDTEKIYSIAEQVGCGNNPQYFSQLFKKYTGMTPTEYIKKTGGTPISQKSP